MSDDGADREWDAAIDDLVGRADERDELPADVQRRMWESISESIAEPDGGGSSEPGDTGENGGGGTSGGESTAGSGQVSAGPESADVGTAIQWLRGSGWVELVSSFLLGATAGVGGYALVDSANDTRTVVERVAPPPSEPVDTGTAADLGAERGDGPAESGRATSRAADTGTDVAETRGGPSDTETSGESRQEARPRDESDQNRPIGDASASTDSEVDATDVGSGFQRERVLLSRAQAALGRGRPEEALEALDEYDARFPDGGLAEESSAIEVRARAAAGQLSEARQLARTFLERHPDSIFRGSMQRILRRSADASD